MSSYYPKIYSLSTIGIIQHFNCDYKFHSNRTDFSGESGSGKSMIADMIQLILVGSGVFKSSTESNKERLPKGMVIPPKGKQNGIGYMFLNIEVALDKYIVIGAYLESSHNKVLPFIIQNGYDWDQQLTPLTEPVLYRELLINNKITPIETLVDTDQLSQFNINQTTRKKYHQLLYDNKILALDLTQEKTLDSYASILRSFSRGKGFNKDSEALKKFLFGDEDEKDLKKKYEEEVKAINDDFHEHKRFSEEIKLINDKQQSIKDLMKVYDEYEVVKEQYFTNKILHWDKSYSSYDKRFNNAKIKFDKSSITQIIISQKIANLEIEMLKSLVQHKEKLNQSELNKEQLNAGVETQEKSFKLAEGEKQKIDKVQEWLNANNKDIEKVKSWFKVEKQKGTDKEMLQRFIEALTTKQQYEAFKSSEWLSDFYIKKEKYEKELIDTENRITTLKALSVFSNIKSPDSLAGWGVENLDFPISHENESVLIYFQELPKEKPFNKKGERYLPFPENLFADLKIKSHDEKGFWIELDGVYEFISYTHERYLDKKSPNEIIEILSGLNVNIKEELEQLKSLRTKEIELHEVLFEFSGLEQAVQLHTNKEQILSHKLSTDLEISKETFNVYIEVFSKKEEVINHYQKTKTLYEKTKKAFNIFESEIKQTKDKVTELETDFEDEIKTTNDLSNLIDKRNKVIQKGEESLKEITEAVQIEEVVKELLILGTNHKKLLIAKERNNSDFSEWQKKKEDFRQKRANAESELSKAKDTFFSEFKKPLEIDGKTTYEEGNPDEGENSLNIQYIGLKSKFEALYDKTKESIDNHEQLVNYSIGMLAHKLLPTVFESAKIDKNLVDENIAKRLDKLARDMQEIGSRKLEILKRIFSEVYKIQENYLYKIKQIDNYLKNKNRAITGGNKAALTYKDSPDYPKGWWPLFRKQLDGSLNNIGLFEDLKDSIDINSLMISAFQKVGGSSKITPKDLLNPKSYFDVTFDLKLDNGESNAGSQGQTYTANALLGLARLSLIEDKKNKGLQIMPIDEAEGLGGNYTMLHELAKKENYQIVSMSIETAGEIASGEQHIYILNDNNSSDGTNYVPPLGIFSNGIVNPNIEEVFVQKEINE